MCPACLNDEARKRFPCPHAPRHNHRKASSCLSTGYTDNSGIYRLPGTNFPANYIATESSGCEGAAGLSADRLKQRFIRGNFSAYVYRQLSVILVPVPRTLKLAGDGEIRHHWQCAGSLPPLPTTSKSPLQAHGYFTGCVMRFPCLAGFTPARPRTGREKRESYVRFCEPHPAFHLRPPRLPFLSLGRARHSESEEQIIGENRLRPLARREPPRLPIVFTDAPGRTG